MAAKVQCVLCSKGYSISQINQLALDTMVCLSCYRQMQQKPVEQSCFGKPSVYEKINGKLVRVVKAYHPQAAECTQFCPDRRICRSLLEGKPL